MIKNSKLLKGIVTTSMVISLLVPSSVFADSTTDVSSTEDISQDYNSRFERVRNNFSTFNSNYKERRSQFKTNVQSRAVRAHAKLLKVIEKYDSENMEQWESLFEEQKLLWNELKDLHKENREDIKENIVEKKEEVRAYRKDLAQKVNSGEMTKEEAVEEFKNHTGNIKENLKNKKEKWKTNFELKKEALKVRRDEGKELRAELVEAIKAENVEEINRILDEVYEFLLDRTEWLENQINELNDNAEEL